MLTQNKLCSEELRLRVTINHFKRSVLEDLHIPNKSQVNALFSTFENIDTGTILTERTWQSWFSSGKVTPKRLKLRELKQIASTVGCSFDGVYLNNSFEQMALGLPLNEIAKSINIDQLTNKVIINLEEDNYLSSIQLYLNAIQLCSYEKISQDDDIELAIKLLAEYGLNQIYLRWCPRSGTLYAKVPSDLKLRWDAADQNERILIEKDFERFKPNLFDFAYKSHSYPKQSSLLIAQDVLPQHIYKFLFGLAGDETFLKPNILKIWFFEMAAAAFFMQVIYWPKQSKSLKLCSDEVMLYSEVFHDLFITACISEVSPSLQYALAECCGEFNYEQIELLETAIKLYRNELVEFGTSAEEVASFVM